MPIIPRDLPAVLHQWLDATLEPGESLLWVGQPDASLYGRTDFKHWGLTALAAAIGGNVIYWMVASTLGPFPPRTINYIDAVLTLIIIVPALIPALLLIMLPIRAKQWARGTLYALTTRRALFATGGTQRVGWHRSLDAPQLAERKLHRCPDGSGTLTFISAPAIPNPTCSRARSSKLSFNNIDDVQAVDDLIARTFHTANQTEV